MRRLFLIMCSFFIIFSVHVPYPALAITSAEKESNYAAAILQLETYLENSGNSSAELAGIESAFRELGGYEQSRFFRYYVAVLMKIADEEYDFQLNTYLDILEDGEFQKYLEESLKGSAIKSIEKLKAYAMARKYEHEGQITDAMEEYKKCLSFFGADERYTSLMEAQYESGYERAMELLKNNNYAAAYCQFAELSGYSDSNQWMDSIVRQLGYTPSSPTDNLMPITGLNVTNAGVSDITLSWNKSNHATDYEIYYKKHNSNNWINAGSTNYITKTITGLEQETSYDFQVVAIIGPIKANGAFLTDRKTASVTPTPKPTPTPSPKPTPTPIPMSVVNVTYMEYGEVRIKCNGGVEPIKAVAYHYFNENHNEGIEKCYEVDGWPGHWVKNGEGIISGMVPGQRYWLKLTDSNGSVLWYDYTAPIGEKFEINVKLNEIHFYKWTTNGWRTASGITATRLEKECRNSQSYDSNIDQTLIGAYLSIGKLTESKQFPFLWALVLPNGDVVPGCCKFTENIEKGGERIQCTGMPWDEIFDVYGCIPIGKYKYLFGVDDYIIGSQAFTLSK